MFQVESESYQAEITCLSRVTDLFLTVRTHRFERVHVVTMQGPVPLLEGRGSSAVAAKVKHCIDRRFTEDLKISSVARELGLSREAMSRTFRRIYGITPVVYRHKLRIYEACRLMNRGMDVTSALYSVGFSDPPQFVHHFRRTLGTNPLRYNPTRMAKGRRSAVIPS